MKESKTILRSGVACNKRSEFLAGNLLGRKTNIINANTFLFLSKDFLFGYWVSVKKLAVPFKVAFKFLTVEVNSIFHTQI